MAPDLHLDFRLEGPQKRFLSYIQGKRKQLVVELLYHRHQQTHEQCDGKGVTSNSKPDHTDTALTAPQLTAGWHRHDPCWTQGGQWLQQWRGFLTLGQKCWPPEAGGRKPHHKSHSQRGGRFLRSQCWERCFKADKKPRGLLLEDVVQLLPPHRTTPRPSRVITISERRWGGGFCGHTARYDFQAHRVLAVCRWASCLTSPRLGFLICTQR